MSSLAAEYPRGQPGNPPATRSIRGRRWEFAAILSSLALVLTVLQGGFTLFYLALLGQLLVLAWTVSRMFSSPRRRGLRGFKLILLVVSALASIQAGNALHTIHTMSSIGRFQQLADQMIGRIEQEGVSRIDLQYPENGIVKASAIRENSGAVRVELALGFGRHLAFFPQNSSPIENAACYRRIETAWYQYSSCGNSEGTPPDITLD